jgi:hydrogenase maturation protease
MAVAAAPVVVIGIGNRHRGDDAAGLMVTDRLRVAPPTGADLAALWGGRTMAILVDAVAAEGEAGRVLRLEGSDPLPREPSTCSTHGLGVVEAIELARVLGTLPSRLVLFGITGRDFAQGAPVSAAVEAALAEAEHAVRTELRSLSREAEDA